MKFLKTNSTGYSWLRNGDGHDAVTMEEGSLHLVIGEFVWESSLDFHNEVALILLLNNGTIAWTLQSAYYNSIVSFE